MSWYQLVSVALAMFTIWTMVPLLYSLIRKVNYTIQLIDRIAWTVVFTNLIVSFVGVPW